jgi:hypothetical protein
MTRATNYSMDLGEISSKIVAPPLVPNMFCPKVSLGKDNQDTYNWNESQCLERIKIDNECTIRCHIANELRIKYNLPESERVISLRNAAFEKAARSEMNKRLIKKWGSLRNISRNVSICKKVVAAGSYRIKTKHYYDVNWVRSIFRDYVRAACPDVYRDFTRGNKKGSLVKLISSKQHKQKFLDALPRIEQ